MTDNGVARQRDPVGTALASLKRHPSLNLPGAWPSACVGRACVGPPIKPASVNFDFVCNQNETIFPDFEIIQKRTGAVILRNQ
jgi:hypothetical protein